VSHAGLRLHGLNGGALLRRVVIQAADAPVDEPGSSSLALRVSTDSDTGAVLRLESSLVIAGRGAPGAAGRASQVAGTEGLAGTPGEGCYRDARGRCDISEDPRASIAPEPPSCGGPRSRGGDGSVIGQSRGGAGRHQRVASRQGRCSRLQWDARGRRDSLWTLGQLQCLGLRASRGGGRGGRTVR
jgi:hypothetical protein